MILEQFARRLETVGCKLLESPQDCGLDPIPPAVEQAVKRARRHGQHVIVRTTGGSMWSMMLVSDLLIVDALEKNKATPLLDAIQAQLQHAMMQGAVAG